MVIRRAALVFGLVLLVLGLAGFVPGLVSEPIVRSGGLEQTLFLGLFPTNAAHNLLHIGFGIAGLVASRGIFAARWFLTVTAVVFTVLTVVGLVPELSSLLGYLPVNGWDVLLHATFVLAAVGVLGYTRAE